MRTARRLPGELVGRLSELVGARLGLHFPVERWQDLERGACAASKESGEEDTGRYVARLLTSTASRATLEMLASHLTVGETCFFREKRSLQILQEHIVPRLPGRPIGIWSAGCATGEEPYSIAILLSQMACRDFRILATDLNVRSLAKASEGVYGEWSFRGAPAWLKPAYFSALPDRRWALHSSIREMVAFSCLNLAEDLPPELRHAVDVVLCRNVLMYFGPDAVRRAVRRLHESLREGGWLIVSPAETSPTLFSDFETVSFGDATLYRKAETAARLPLIPEIPTERLVEAPPPAVPTPRRNRIPAMLRLARAHANRGELREAFRWCERAIAAGSADAPAHYLRAAILQEQGVLEEAARSLRRALYLDPQFVIGHFALANLAAKRGRPKESEKHLQNAVGLLAAYGEGDILPESGGLTAGRLKDLIARRSHA